MNAALARAVSAIASFTVPAVMVQRSMMPSGNADVGQLGLAAGNASAAQDEIEGHDRYSAAFRPPR